MPWFTLSENRDFVDVVVALGLDPSTIDEAYAASLKAVLTQLLYIATSAGAREEREKISLEVERLKKIEDPDYGWVYEADYPWDGYQCDEVQEFIVRSIRRGQL